MGLARDTREVKKAKAFMRAQFSLRQRFERIDYEEDVVIPTVNEIVAGRKHFELEAGEGFLLKEEDVEADNGETP